MIAVNCDLASSVKRPRPLVDKICKSWREEISLKESKFKIEININQGKFNFELIFITWQSMYLTGKIIFECK